VLYVEDDVLVRNSTISMFEEHRILYEAFSSLDGMEDRLRSLERVPDLLIADFRLPDGHTAEDVVRMVDRTLAVTLPIIVISGEALSAEQQNRLGAAPTRPTRFLRKPVAPEVLMAEISVLCAV
jgi:CheY-like chemotaxis protein